jgi:hypothetical protein
VEALIFQVFREGHAEALQFKKQGLDFVNAQKTLMDAGI